MTSRQHLEAELEQIQKKSGWITFIVWSVAVLVMVFGIPIVYELLTQHDVPGEIAWLLSIASDGALIVGLVATPVLAIYGVPAGWIGTLRWIAGFITWGLQTLGPFTQNGGPDVIGVITHSAGPVLLFFVVEGASYFQRRMGEVITTKRRELEALEKVDRDDKAHRADITNRLAAALRDLETANRDVTELTNRLAAVTAEFEAYRVTAVLTAERQEAEIGSLRTTITEQAERLTAERDEALREANRRYREKLAEAKTVSLTDYRNRTGGKGGDAAAGKAVISDEAAVQMMLDEQDDPGFEWSKNAVRGLTGVGLNRAERLIPLWLTAATGKADGGTAVNQ